MRIGKKAKLGMIKQFDKDREIAIAIDEKGNGQVYVKCLAKDFKKRTWQNATDARKQ